MARVRHFSASSDSTGSGPCRAASQLGLGHLAAAAHHVPPPRVGGDGGGALGVGQIRGSAARGSCAHRTPGSPAPPEAPPRRRAIRRATAGADVRPGESKQATLKKPGASGASPSTKSPSAQLARSPAKFVTRPRVPTPAHVLRAASLTKERPSAVVDTSVLENCSTAEGTTSRFPCTVGVTSTPFPEDEGAWNMVCENAPAPLGCRRGSTRPGAA